MIHLDTMRVSDRDAVLAIDLASFHPSEIGAERGDPRVVRGRQLDEELARPWARLRVARSDADEVPSAVVGYSLVWHVADEIHLLNVAVRASSRRQGVGRVLVDDIVAYAREKGAAKILLEVRMSNAPAIALYESLGFERFNVRTRYYADDEDALEMMLELG